MTYLTKLSLVGTILLSLENVQAEEPKQLNFEQGKLAHAKISGEMLRLAHRIYQSIEPFLLDSDIDARAVGMSCDVEGISLENKHKLILKIATLIQEKRSIELNLLAFPFKSGNRQHNVFGHMADMAEYKSLEYLDSMRAKIAEIYPNTKFTIFTDGLLFNDLFEIPDQHVADYEQSMQHLTQQFPEIKIITFSEILNESGLNLVNVRMKSDQEAIKATIPPDKLELIKKRILREINHAGHSYAKLSPKEQATHLDHLALLVLRRVKTGGMIVARFEEQGSIHLSTHYQQDFDKKLGIKLFANSVVTPPNAVLVEEADGTLLLKYKQDVDPAKYKLKSISINNVACPYFSWR